MPVAVTQAATYKTLQIRPVKAKKGNPMKAAALVLVTLFTNYALAAQVTISSFTPQSLSESPNQIRAVFSEKVVSLGVNPDADIFDITCTPQTAGRGKWDDEKSWSYNFSTKLYSNKLPGGTRCQVKLKAAFKNAKNVKGRTNFAFQVDGPNILEIFPGDTNGTSKVQVDEDQVFALGLDAAVDAQSLNRFAYFRVEGVASPIQIRVLSPAEVRTIQRAENYPRYMFDKELPLIMLQAREKFPANKKVSLVWDKGIKSQESGLERQRQLVLPFETRPQLSAAFTCERENANADCSPFSQMELKFTENIPAELAKQIRLVGADGKVIPAVIEDKGASYVGRVTFPALINEKGSYRLELPSGIKDDAGRSLSNQASFPLTIKTSEFPPLAKFAADFGIIEAAGSPILPATLRNVEAEVGGGSAVPTQVNGAQVRLTADNFAQVVDWMKTLDIRSSATRGLKSRDVSVFDMNKSVTPKGFKVPVKDAGKAFEVIGIPLAGPGFYVVELHSKMLGRSLLGKDANMYVPTGALVTNLVVHSKVGRENSLFWVTSLDNGSPVAGAQVAVHDCMGKALFSGQTDANGVYKYNGELYSKIDPNACRARTEDEPVSYKYNNGFFVSAAKDGDFTFTHSSWNDGIEMWRFGSINADSPVYGATKVLAHSVIDRTLLRAGETVSMKHFMRQPVGQGFRALKPEALPNQLEIAHVDTDARYVAKLEWDQNGTAISEFSIPKEAKLGLYSIRLNVTGRGTNGELDVKQTYETSFFQVMEFKIPLMKGEISFPAQIQRLVQPGQLDAQVSVQYQDGGPAVNEKVKFRYTIARNDGVLFQKNFGYAAFGMNRVTEGQVRHSDEAEQTEKTVEIPLRLDRNGAGVASVPGLRGLDAPKLVTTQLEFTDRNSETQNVSRNVTVYPSNRLVAISVEDAYGSPKKIKFQAAVADLKGEPIAGVQPEFELYEETTFTHKTRMVGGFYSSESFTETKRKAAQFTCAGNTNRQGLVNCEVTAPESGKFVIQASVSDQQNNRSYASGYAYVRGVNRAWFPSQNNDRMDLIAAKKDLQAGETAELQVQMPFAEATALITVEREGIVEHFVKKISTTDPRVQIAIKEEYAPNVYVSVLAVRGRVAGAGETATVDLGKPAYKLGMAALNVNWKANALNVSVKPSKDVLKPRETAAVEVTVLNGQNQPAANAEFAIAVVDEALLQLSKNRTWELLKAMMGERALEVETATAQMQVVGKRHYGLKARPTGGDGGMAPTRELFDTLIAWVPRVKTDASGKATVNVKMNDSLSKFKIVAIAHTGLNKFGTGEASVITQKEISVSPALGQIARNGDSLSVEMSLRNATRGAKAGKVTGKVILTYAGGRQETRNLGTEQYSLGSLDSKQISLGQSNIPDEAVLAEYEVQVLDESGNVVDVIKIRQEIKPAIYVRTWMAQLEQLTGPKSVNVTLPAQAIPNKGGVKISMVPTLASSLDTVVDSLKNYPFKSLELDISRAVAMNDRAQWDAAMAKLPTHLDQDGLVMYFPSASASNGSDVLTAYILSLAKYSGFEVPEAQSERMITALKSFVEGRIRNVRAETPADTFIRRVNAIEVLARYGQAQGVMLTSLPAIAPQQIPTATLIDLVSAYTVLANAPQRQAQLDKYQRAIKDRLTRTGTHMGLAGFPTPWYLMTSTHGDQLELILVLSSNSALTQAWRTEIPLLVRGGILNMAGGAWHMTTANAVGVLALKAYAKVFEPANATGMTEIALNQVKRNFDWAANQKGGAVEFAWPSTGDHKVDLVHRGTGAPWSIVAVNAAVKLTQKVEKNIEVTKTLSPNQATYKKGDVVTVTLKVKPQRDIGFISLMDPIPAGAKIVGVEESTADFQELSYEAYRASYGWVPGTGFEVVYKVQVNNAGTFKLPATRVEAIYMPENFAEMPNADWTVTPQ